MNQWLIILFASITLTVGCTSRVDSKSHAPRTTYNVSSPRKEIIAQNVLAAQLAPHHELEAKTTFAPTESIQASLYLTGSTHVEPRRISAFLVRDEAVVEEQSIAAGADEKRQDFDFRFAKTPRPAGAYQIKFVEIARSNGKPVLLARLFLNVE